MASSNDLTGSPAGRAKIYDRPDNADRNLMIKRALPFLIALFIMIAFAVVLFMFAGGAEDEELSGLVSSGAALVESRSVH